MAHPNRFSERSVRFLRAWCQTEVSSGSFRRIPTRLEEPDDGNL